MFGWPPRTYPAFAALLFLFGPPLKGTSLAATVNVSVSNFVFTPGAAAPAQGDVVQWNFVGPSFHTATEQTGLQLFNSGILGAGGVFPFTFVAAGTYQYRCSIHPTVMTGTVAVPITAAPASLLLGASVTVTWASAALPVGYVVDLEVKPPNAGNFQPLLTGTSQKKATGVPPIRGTYTFRARLRRMSNGATSLFSPVVTINVT